MNQSNRIAGICSSIHSPFAESAAATGLFEAARIAYDAALGSNRYGGGTYTDLVNNKTELTHAQAEAEYARANAFTAAAALAFAIGSTRSSD